MENVKVLKKIAVVFGGNSPEYGVSLVSAAAVLNVLEKAPYEVIKIGITSTGDWYLVEANNEKIEADEWFSEENCQRILPGQNKSGFFLPEKQTYLAVDVVFPVLHGRYGEDGCIQGIFEMMELPYVGCGVAASALCMNKWLLHTFAESIGIASAPTLLLSKNENQPGKLASFVAEHGFPLFVKPNEAGSSKGVGKVESEEALQAGLEEAFRFDKKVIVQTAVKGVEIGCGILGNDELIVGACDEIELSGGFFDFVEKYQLLTAKINTPANISEAVSEKIKNQAMKLYRGIGCQGLSRLDFFLTEDGEILLNEINTLPGFTSHSRFPKMMGAIGIEYAEIVERLIVLGEEAYHEKNVSSTSE